jgi:branched-subunit amino acid transport protein
MEKVLSEFFTNAAVALFAAGAVAPMFTQPKDINAIWPYFLASIGTVLSLTMAGYFENKVRK